MAEDNYAKNARQDKLNRDEYAGYLREKEQERIDNEAPRKALGEAFDYVKGKAKDLANSDFVKGMKDVVSEGTKAVSDDFQRIAGTERGKQLDAEAKERELKKMRGPDLDKIFQARRMKEEASRYKKGGKVDRRPFENSVQRNLRQLRNGTYDAPMSVEEKMRDQIKQRLLQEKTSKESMAKGGKITTAQKNPKHKNCW